MTRPVVSVAEQAPPLVKGMPRPLAAFPAHRRRENFDYSRLPVPWINWSRVHEDEEWILFDAEAMRELMLANYMLCGNCGERLGEVQLFGNYSRVVTENGQRKLIPGTSGAGLHPACALLSYHYCPYLKDQGPDDAFYVHLGALRTGLDVPDDAPEVADLEDFDMDEVFDISVVDLRLPVRKISLEEIKQLAREERSPSQRCPVAHPRTDVACPAAR